MSTELLTLIRLLLLINVRTTAICWSDNFREMIYRNHHAMHEVRYTQIRKVAIK